MMDSKCCPKPDCNNQCKTPTALTMDEASFPLWEKQANCQNQSIPNNAWFTMWFPSQSDECQWIPRRVKHGDYIDQIENNCFGDIKMNSVVDSDCLCGSGCWFLANGRKLNYYDEAGKLKECFRMPDLRGKTMVMPDPRDYFGTGITALGMCVGEAKHIQKGEEVGPQELEIEATITFDLCLDQNVETTDDGEGGSSITTGDNAMDKVNYSTDFEDPATTGNYREKPVNFEGNVQSSEEEAVAMNIMQPSYGMNFYFYGCKDGLEVSVDESSLPDQKETDELGNQTQNNDCPWWRP